MPVGEARKCGGGWLATAAVYVEIGRWAVEQEMDCLYTKEKSPGTKHNKYYSNGTK